MKKIEDANSPEFFGDYDRLYGEHAFGVRPRDPKLRAGLDKVEPFFFGPGDRLYGSLHRPRTASETGVVLCNAVGHEFFRSHRAYLVLAHRLVSAGQTVLRFDYRGTGDSQGGYDAGGLSAWVEDTSMAIEVLRDRAAISEVHLVGRRLGGLIAACTAKRQKIAGLALWDAVLDGHDYFEELRQLHEEYLSGYHYTRSSVRLNEIPLETTQENEFLGAGFSDRSLREFESCDLSTLRKVPARSILWLESAEVWRGWRSLEPFRSAGASVSLVHSPDPVAWDYDALLKQTVPVPVLDALVSWSTDHELAV